MRLRIGHKNKHINGFTLVELLIVIVVIAILAAISVVAYNGIQQRANDTSIQNDISNLAKKAKLFHAEYGYYPWTGTHFSAMDLSVGEGAYDHYDNGNSTYNLVYCYYPSTQPTSFAIVGYGKNDSHFMYTADGRLTEFPTASKLGSIGACSAAGVSIATGSDRYWFFDAGSWRSYL